MYLADSGSTTRAIEASASGAAPPSSSTLLHPNCGIIHAARKPPKDAPSGKAQNIALVTSARILIGQYSLISVTALGMAAPRPRPVRNRQIVRPLRLPAVAASKLDAPMTTIDTTSTVLRPNLSASGPALSAPPASPNNAALSTGARSGLATFHSETSEG